MDWFRNFMMSAQGYVHAYCLIYAICSPVCCQVLVPAALVRPVRLEANVAHRAGGPGRVPHSESGDCAVRRRLHVLYVRRLHISCRGDKDAVRQLAFLRVATNCVKEIEERPRDLQYVYKLDGVRVSLKSLVVQRTEDMLGVNMMVRVRGNQVSICVTLFLVV